MICLRCCRGFPALIVSEAINDIFFRVHVVESSLQTWDKLIVNTNTLLMHYFFQVIQGNGQFTSFWITLMLIQCITFVKIHCITWITLNYCLSEILPSIVCRLHNREMIYTTKGCYFHLQFSLVQLACKDCYLTKVHAKWTVKLASKGFEFISIKWNSLQSLAIPDEPWIVKM